MGIQNKFIRLWLDSHGYVLRKIGFKFRSLCVPHKIMAIDCLIYQISYTEKQRNKIIA